MSGYFNARSAESNSRLYLNLDSHLFLFQKPFSPDPVEWVLELLAQEWILNYLPDRKLPEDTGHGWACKHTWR
jgi:hypothetical protein